MKDREKGEEDGEEGRGYSNRSCGEGDVLQKLIISRSVTIPFFPDPLPLTLTSIHPPSACILDLCPCYR